LLISLSAEIKELGDASVYSPKEGKLMQFLSLLNEKNITFGTHFKTLDKDRL
jgi:hypothetical protein